ncbi:hypothetical protein SAMN04489740_1120 [Arthrobacter alpinus]|uniref:Uncharacterized protein n=1 Tax=Arthrobacter alpinus TaxID=656366 RepID=A0A1H5HWE2_9MICC|nr:hypothetical protein SAMN04489740_1120 [Arthrobacter alpinus]
MQSRGESLSGQGRRIDVHSGAIGITRGSRMRYQDPSWWQLGCLYAISGTILLPPLPLASAVVEIVSVAITTTFMIVKVVRSRSADKRKGPASF